MAGLLDGPYGAGLLGNLQRGLAQIAHQDPYETERQRILRELGPDATMGDVANRLRQMGDFKGFMSVSQLADTQTQRNRTDDIKEFEYAKKQGFTGSLQDWMQRKRAGAGEYSLNPTWGVDRDGNPAIVQLGKGGEAVAPKFPEGFRVGKDAIRLDAGTEWVLLDPVSRQVVGRQPKNVAAAASEREVGEAQGKAKVALPDVLSNAENMLKQIDETLTHPGKKSIFALGPLGSVPAIPGTEQAGFVQRVDQLKGQAFLRAYETLKGGGAIALPEGEKGTQAIARLQRAVTEKEFDAALNDLRGIVVRGIANAKLKAGQGTQMAPKNLGGGSDNDPLGLRR